MLACLRLQPQLESLCCTRGRRTLVAADFAFVAIAGSGFNPQLPRWSARLRSYGGAAAMCEPRTSPSLPVR